MLKSEDPHMVPLPEPYDKRLAPFQRLMLLKVLREEKLV
jgi:dynein heavy chain